jgi:hypothetical protein
MTLSQRAQYLYDRSAVDLVERRQERSSLNATDANAVDLATGASHADLRQAVLAALPIVEETDIDAVGL